MFANLGRSMGAAGLGLLCWLAVWLVLTPAVAAAKPDIKTQTAQAVQAIRSEVGQSLAAYRAGDRDQAYKLARSAYLDHFELIEIPLRIVESDFTLEMELRFADLRNQMRAGAPVGEVEATARAVYTGLDQVDATLEGVGRAAPAAAFFVALALIFREAFEAVLLIAALIAALAGMQQRHLARYVYQGAGLAALASLALFAFNGLLGSLAPALRDLIEALTGLAAVVLLFLMSFWLLQRLEHKRWMEYVRGRVWEAVNAGRPLALVGTAFTAVFREGFETAVFFSALTGFAQQAQGYVYGGLAVGAALVVAAAVAMFRFGVKLPTRTLLSSIMGITALLSVALLGGAIRELQSLGYFPITIVQHFPHFNYTFSQLTGIHPTVQTLAAQGGLLLIYLAGLIWLMRLRRPAGAQA
ncbi:MAG TPA: FTR1 family protein [Limnochordia bacterium]|nr:FTR1 family protein [Limnochordia bacterium]